MDDSEMVRAALEQARNAMTSVTVFVNTRERIKQPEGRDWWSNEIEAVDRALRAIASTPPDPKPDLRPGLEAAADKKWLHKSQVALINIRGLVVSGKSEAAAALVDEYWSDWRANWRADYEAALAAQPAQGEK